VLSHDELDADHDPERALPLRRGFRLVLALNRIDALFDHAVCGSNHRLVRPDRGFVEEAMILGMGFERLRPLVTDRALRCNFQASGSCRKCRWAMRHVPQKHG
jgi:hypothetical protein